MDGFVLLAALAVTALCDVDEKGVEEAREPRIFAYYSTTSMTKLTTVTKTDISTCLSSVAKHKLQCDGRKKRRVALEDLKFDLVNIENEINSGMENSDNVREERLYQPFNQGEDSFDVDKNNREGKALTIWSTNFSTITITTTSIMKKSTVSVSVFCTTIGFAQTCFAG
ncbi:unnamed protein product [Meganyctiphanes norvegica]|uniref:Uncharacterized protein n=1 Tax=Meganyctiphanes norvegica TaxID=48144 RepID=A0AAV2RQ01_MEGNR